MAIITVRINFGLSDQLRQWISQQTGFIRVVEESQTHITVQFDLTGPEAVALKQAFNDRLIEVL